MNTYGFVGLGLIGGSIAKALKKADNSCRIIAHMPDRPMLERAVADGIVDTAANEDDVAFRDCDIIFLCAPVRENIAALERLKKLADPACIITDVGSTKGAICNRVRQLGLEGRFVGGHPMTGSEKTGYGNADALLLENAFYMLCTVGHGNNGTADDGANAGSTESAGANLARMTELVKAIKAIPMPIDYRQHDTVAAYVSHLPHIIAACLVNLVRDSDSEHGIMRTVAAGGFKDITRISGASPILWEQICAENREAVTAAIDAYMASLSRARDIIAGGDAPSVRGMFDDARKYRCAISDGRGMVNAQYSFSIHVQDRPGAISIVSAILASDGISIKNIGINHNREAGEGALRVIFYDAESCSLAAKRLAQYNYKISEN